MRKPSHTPYWTPVIKFILCINIVGCLLMISIGAAPRMPGNNFIPTETIEQTNQVKSFDVDIQKIDNEGLIKKVRFIEKILGLFTY